MSSSRRAHGHSKSESSESATPESIVMASLQVHLGHTDSSSDAVVKLALEDRVEWEYGLSKAVQNMRGTL